MKTETETKNIDTRRMAIQEEATTKFQTFSPKGRRHPFARIVWTTGKSLEILFSSFQDATAWFDRERDGVAQEDCFQGATVEAVEDPASLDPLAIAGFRIVRPDDPTGIIHLQTVLLCAR